MISLEVKEARVFVRPGATDMRKQINGLALIIEQVMESNVFEPALFLFCNGDRRILKALYWDRTGFCNVAEAVGETSVSLVSAPALWFEKVGQIAELL